MAASVIDNLLIIFEDDHEECMAIAPPSDQSESEVITREPTMTKESQIDLDRLAAAELERQEILNICLEADLLNPFPSKPLLTESEIMSLFDSGFDVDMIVKAYPEFTVKRVSQLKRAWSDKIFRDQKEPRKKRKSGSQRKSKGTFPNNEDTERGDDATFTHSPSAVYKKKRRRRVKTEKEMQQKGGYGDPSKTKYQCDWCSKYFPSDKHLKAHFKEFAKMHPAC